jgi:hypothetical protein
LTYAPTLGALIAAVAAIATAVISSSSNSADTQRRIDFEAAAAHTDTVGAARVLAKELATVEVYMEGMLSTGRMFPFDEKYNVELSTSDQKLIASAKELGVDGWQRVAAALSNLDTLESYIRSKYRRGEGSKLDAGDVAVFELDIKAIDGAWDALKPLAGEPRPRKDPFGSG